MLIDPPPPPQCAQITEIGNKFINIQILRFLLETFSISLFGSSKKICDVIDDFILQVSGQEPSMSSKYGLHGRVVPDTLPTMLESCYMAHKYRITYHYDLWSQICHYPPSTWSGIINIPQGQASRTGGFWHNSYGHNSTTVCQILEIPMPAGSWYHGHSCWVPYCSLWAL